MMNMKLFRTKIDDTTGAFVVQENIKDSKLQLLLRRARDEFKDKSLREGTDTTIESYIAYVCKKHNWQWVPSTYDYEISLKETILMPENDM